MNNYRNWLNRKDVQYFEKLLHLLEAIDDANNLHLKIG